MTLNMADKLMINFAQSLMASQQRERSAGVVGKAWVQLQNGASASLITNDSNSTMNLYEIISEQLPFICQRQGTFHFIVRMRSTLPTIIHILAIFAVSLVGKLSSWILDIEPSAVSVEGASPIRILLGGSRVALHHCVQLFQEQK